MQKYKLRARTFEVDENGNPITYGSLGKDMTVLGGKAAGVCYMPDDYMESGIQNVDAAVNRAKGNVKSGHHSVFDHGHITLELKTNKMLAMIFNSLGVYATSEKSGRYTKMKGTSKRESELYDKWCGIIQGLTISEYPWMDDAWLQRSIRRKTGDNTLVVKNRKIVGEVQPDEVIEKYEASLKSKAMPSFKIAIENARYMLSVYTPTVLLYTISWRQANLIHDYLGVLYENITHAEDAFSKSLIPHIAEAKEELDDVLERYKEEIDEMKKKEEEDVVYPYDNKNQHIRFLACQQTGEMKNGSFVPFDEKELLLMRRPKRISINDSYTITYLASMVAIADIERHRTLRYTISITEPGEYGFYVPDIVKKYGKEEEWMHDISSVAALFPEGTIVFVTEQGIVEDFVMKCKERLCGRPQHEVMKIERKCAEAFVRNINKLCYENRKLIQNICNDGINPCPRCMFPDFKCSEGCVWGAKDAFNRLV